MQLRFLCVSGQVFYAKRFVLMSTHTRWLHFQPFSSDVFFVAFILRALASWSDPLLLPKRGILIDEKEYNGKRMITNESNRVLATELNLEHVVYISNHCGWDGGMWEVCQGKWRSVIGQMLACDGSIIFSSFPKNQNLNLNDYVEVPRSLVLYDVGGLR